VDQPVTARRRPPLVPLAVLLALAALARPAAGHQLDEYLQATIVEIDPDMVRLKINLTPGIEVAAQVLDRIDLDHDNAISPQEAKAYGEALRQDLSVRLDGKDIPLKLATIDAPSPEDLRTGWSFIQAEFTGGFTAPPGGTHHLTIENRHLPAISAYLLNAAMPTTREIRIVRQSRNTNQSRGEIEFTTPPRAKPSPTIAIAASVVAVLGALLVTLWRARRRL
jgi:hypothetical protein